MRALTAPQREVGGPYGLLSRNRKPPAEGKHAGGWVSARQGRRSSGGGKLELRRCYALSRTSVLGRLRSSNVDHSAGTGLLHGQRGRSIRDESLWNTSVSSRNRCSGALRKAGQGHAGNGLFHFWSALGIQHGCEPDVYLRDEVGSRSTLKVSSKFLELRDARAFMLAACKLRYSGVGNARNAGDLGPCAARAFQVLSYKL